MVIILSHRKLLISSNMATSVVDLPDPVGPVMSTSHCLACINFSMLFGSHNSSQFLAFFSILLREKLSCPRDQKPFTRNETSFFLET